MAAIVPAEFAPAPPAVGPTRYGLFTAANGPLELTDRGSIAGYQWEPDSCGVARLYTNACPASEQADKGLDAPDGESSHPMEAEPFIVYASVVCPPFGGHGPDRHRQRAIARLLGGEQAAAEEAFWNGGGVGAVPNLQGAGATVVTPAEAGFAARIAALEAAFYAAHGYVGTIHVNTAANGAAADTHMIADGRDPANRLLTPTGSVWSFGAGYGINGPADAAPAAGSVWAFMTPQVTVWRTPEPFVPPPEQTFDRTANQMYAIAERSYVIGYACDTVFAVQVPVEAPCPCV